MTTKLTCLVAALVLILFSCKKEKEDPIPEVPLGIIRTDSSPILSSHIVELFPSGKKALDNIPALFSDTVQKNIILTEESEVYITFIAESATYRNTVGWYSYMKDNPPQSAKDVELHLLFPNASALNSGGELSQGNMLQVGETKFPKGTVIGFFLIVNGWRDGSIDYNATTLYTDYNLNSDSHQQHALFKVGKDIVLGFEDTPLSITNYDGDYNDLLFVISDNNKNLNPISFEISKLPTL